MNRNQRILLAGLILAALILIFPTIGHCTRQPVSSSPRSR